MPEISGTFGKISRPTSSELALDYVSGCFVSTRGNAPHNSFGYRGGVAEVTFMASRSSKIYGNSTTVQPPAYTVRAWLRVS